MALRDKSISFCREFPIASGIQVSACVSINAFVN